MNRKECNVEKCKYPRFAKGYCSMHQYLRTDKKPKEVTPKKSIRKVSDKMKEQLKIYSVLSKKFKEDNPLCMAKYKDCTIFTTDVHHKAKRGKNLNNVETFMAVCRTCHNTIHENPYDAKEKGFLI
jgi:hypothetical protein